MAWTRWRLCRVNDSDRENEGWMSQYYSSQRRPEGQISVSFVREQTRRGNKPSRKDTITIEVEADGLTRTTRGGVTQGVKPFRRERLHRLACQAAAYYALTGSIEGFPEQEFI